MYVDSSRYLIIVESLSGVEDIHIFDMSLNVFVLFLNKERISPPFVTPIPSTSSAITILTESDLIDASDFPDRNLMNPPGNNFDVMESALALPSERRSDFILGFAASIGSNLFFM